MGYVRRVLDVAPKENVLIIIAGAPTVRMKESVCGKKENVFPILNLLDPIDILPILKMFYPFPWTAGARRKGIIAKLAFTSLAVRVIAWAEFA